MLVGAVFSIDEIFDKTCEVWVDNMKNKIECDLAGFIQNNRITKYGHQN